MSEIQHKDIVGASAIHPSNYYQSGDPGAVGANKMWLDTTTTPPIQKRRNSTDTGWDEALDPSDYATVAALAAVELNDLADVDTTGVSTGDVLTYDGADWVASAPTGGTVTYAEIRRTTDQLISNVTFTAVSFDTEDADTGSYWAIGTPDRFTITNTGFYLFGTSVRWANNVTGVRTLSVVKNSTTAEDNKLASVQMVTSGNNEQQTASGAAVLTAGDYIAVIVRQNSGGNLNLDRDGGGATTLTYFQRFWIARLA